MKKSNTPAATAPTNYKREFAFVRYELDESQRAECKKWSPTLVELDDEILKMNEELYTISLKYDDYNSCYSCNITMPDVKHANYNLCLTGRGSTPFKALKQALYKHHSVDHVWPIPEFSAGRKVEFDD